MKRLIVLLLLCALPVYASLVVIFQQPNGAILQIIPSADTLQYLNRTDALINPQFPVSAVNMYVTNGFITNYTAAVVLANLLGQSNSTFVATTNFYFTQRTENIFEAKNFAKGTNVQSRLMRHIALLTLDQINVLRKASTNNLNIITTNAFINALSNAIAGDAL